MKRQFLSAASAIIFLDQFTKYLAFQAGLSTINRGVSLGIASTNNQIILATSIIFLLIALWLWQKSLWLKYPVVAGLLFGGAISNLIDRVLFQGVRDWLPVPGVNLTNNIADWSITVALAAILVLEVRDSRNRSKHQTEHQKEKETDGT